MAKLTKLSILLFILTCSTTVYSQTQKFGHIDLNALMQIMPEMKTAEKEFNDFQKDLEDVLAEMQQGYSVKLKELEALGNDVSEVKRNAKFSEIQALQQRIQNFQATAQQQAEQKNQQLIKPVYDKAIKAIEEVSVKQGLIYVFDTGTQVLLYKSNQSIDILPLVKQNLGIN
jgi:outer membrane protein